MRGAHWGGGRDGAEGRCGRSGEGGEGALHDRPLTLLMMKSAGRARAKNASEKEVLCGEV